MNKTQMIEKLQATILEDTRYQYSKQSLNTVINTMAEIIMEELNNGGQVNITNLGTFAMKVQPPRTFYNIHTGFNELSKPKRVVEFNVSRKFRSSM